MSEVRFVEVELDYGCHAGGRRFRFPQKTAPVVLAGPNGAGKSTLLDALVRTLYGFNRRLDEDKLRLDARRPWTGEPCRARVVLADADGVLWQLERRFGDAEVELRALAGTADDGEPAWRGDGNPGATNAEAREYRRRLEERIGLAERAAYEATACVHQGELARTRLDDELLRIAAGGHGDVDAAIERVKAAYRERTKRPIEAADRGGRNPRELERVEEEIAAVRRELQAASAAERRRRPLLEEREQAAARIEALEAEIRRLEAAQGPLAERGRLEAERGAARERLETLERTRRRVDEARRARADARRARDRLGPLHPDDFPARLSELRVLWERRDRLAVERSEAEEALAAAGSAGWTRPVLAGLSVAAAAGVALAATGRMAAGAALAALVLVAGGAVFWMRRRATAERERRRDEVADRARESERLERRIAELLHGVPRAETLSAATASERRDRYEHERAVQGELERAEARLADAVAAARDALPDESAEDAGGSDAEAVDVDPESRDRGGSAADAATEVDRLLERLDRAIGEARTAVARADVALDGGAAAGLDLPEGVAAETDRVRAALRERRDERRRLGDRVQQLHRELVEAASGHDSPVALRDRLDGLVRRKAELERDAAAYGRAYTLLRDAYEAFRARDQERLLDGISGHLTKLTDGALGPLESTGALAEARVRAFGRPVALSSPPLSYGELHATLLAIRLGATEFLGRAGIRPPLLVDEPFAHLDDERAAGVWTLLCAIARERQVIVATQDTATLARVGAEVDVSLERPALAGARAEAPGATTGGD